jgi:transcriptional regulator with XRE-family HTH domain
MSSVIEIGFGGLVRSRRLGSVDPTTGMPFTQQRMADIISDRIGKPVARTAYVAWENGRSGMPSAEVVNVICDVLEIDVADALAAAGFRLDRSLILTGDERDLLAEYRRLRKSPALQDTALRVIRALRPHPRA